MAECNLAIETASHQGWVTLGRGEVMIETAGLPRRRRHNIELMPTVDALFSRHGLERDDLAEVYVSLGPGSFTGLRLALATVKMLAMALPVRVVGVPSLEVIAHNAPADAKYVAAGLNYKRGAMHSQVFEALGTAETRWFYALNEARLRALDELLHEAPRPVMLLGDQLPELPADFQNDARVAMLPADAALPRSEVVWRLGRARAANEQYDDPATLNPLYIREPEAVTLWREKQDI